MTTKLMQDMGMEKVSHIETGFAGWQDAGFDVLPYDDWKASQA